MKKIKLLICVWKQIRGKNAVNDNFLKKIFDKKNIIYFQTNAIHILNETRAPLHIDGDVTISDRDIKIYIEKKYFKKF